MRESTWLLPTARIKTRTSRESTSYQRAKSVLIGRGPIADSGLSSPCPYSPECVEGVFSEVRYAEVLYGWFSYVRRGHEPPIVHKEPQ
jgi:hypothetical protein